MRYNIGVDIGGTFTDFVAEDFKGGKIFSEKVLTTPDHPAEAVIQGLYKLSQAHNLEIREIKTIIHATTLATNALIERKGAVTGLLTTRGFEDVLDIRKGLRYNQYDLKIQFPKAIVQRYLRRGVSERMLASGQVRKQLVESEVVEKTSELIREGITSLAVSFLHSYINPVHEISTKKIIAENFPDVEVSTSHEVTTQAREYERTCSVVVDAYIKPMIRAYLDDLNTKLAELGFAGKLLIMTCSGGVVETTVAKNTPVLLLESGPVAGTSISQQIATRLRIKNAFSFDMGGTTAKGCVIRNCRAEKAYEFEAARVDKFRRGSGIPISIPTVRLIEIGSGGGSIARVDPLGIVRLGPESAGAKPGPASYALGGELPTLTDADLVLGYLDEDFFLGGQMKLDKELAKRAIENSICSRTNLSVEEAAWAIHERANEDVAAAFRTYSSEMGVDHRNFTFIAFGGAGPMHAVRIAKKLGAMEVVVPLRAGVLSAEGLLVSPLSIDVSQSRRLELADLTFEKYAAYFQELTERGRSILLSAGLRNSDLRTVRALDMCYHGQGYDVTVDLGSSSISKSEFSRIDKEFESAYAKSYSVSGFSTTAPIEITTFKVTVTGPEKSIPVSSVEGSNYSKSKTAFDPTRRKFRKFDVRSRYSLKKREIIRGPGLVQEIESTTVIPEGYLATVDQFSNLIVRGE